LSSDSPTLLPVCSAVREQSILTPLPPAGTQILNKPEFAELLAAAGWVPDGGGTDGRGADFMVLPLSVQDSATMIELLDRSVEAWYAAREGEGRGTPRLRQVQDAAT